MVIDVIGNDIYYIHNMGDGSIAINQTYEIYKYNLVEETNELYWSLELNNDKSSSYPPVLLDKSRFYAVGKYWKLNIINKTVETVNIGEEGGMYLNNTILVKHSSEQEKLVNMLTGIQNTIKNSPTSSNHAIKFINEDCTKIIYKDVLYELTPDLTLGSVLNENPYENIPEYGKYFIHYVDDYYYNLSNYSNGSFNFSKAYLMKFNETLNTFEYVYTLGAANWCYNNYKYTLQLHLKNDNGDGYKFLTNTKNNILKGYKYDGYNFYINNHVVTSDNVLNGITVYSETGNSIVGTMPNNKAIEITPSAKEQIIPKGYHNGGTEVQTTQNLLPENIKNGIEIFGVTGTYTGEATAE